MSPDQLCTLDYPIGFVDAGRGGAQLLEPGYVDDTFRQYWNSPFFESLREQTTVLCLYDEACRREVSAQLLNYGAL